jgi:hypothetical protein
MAATAFSNSGLPLTASMGTVRTPLPSTSLIPVIVARDDSGNLIE